MITKIKKLKDGFTLVELVVVIAVLSILSAVAIPAFTGVILRARQAAAIAYVDATIKSGLIFDSNEYLNIPREFDHFS